MTARVLPSDPPWLKAAFRDLGLREIAGARHNPRVIEMFARAGHPEVSDDETAWCAAAVGCWLAEAGQPNSGNLMARSYLKYGRKLDIGKKLPRGAIVIWPRGKPQSGQGHVNVVLEDDGETLTCIGGNQSPAPGAVSISHAHKDDLLGATWPAKYPLPGDPVPMPKPRPKVETEPEPDPVPLPPKRPPAPEPEPETPSPPGFLRRQWQRFKRVLGIGTGTGAGVGFLGWMTEPWAVAAMIAGGILLLILLYIAALHLFGKDRVRDALSRLFRKVIPS